MLLTLLPIVTDVNSEQFIKAVLQVIEVACLHQVEAGFQEVHRQEVQYQAVEAALLQVVAEEAHLPVAEDS